MSLTMRPQPLDKDNIFSDVKLRTYSPPITKKEKRNFQRSQHRRDRRSAPTFSSSNLYSSNPLLDTISVLASDRFESDDEYNEIPMCKKFSPIDRKYTEECAGYAGSNSIDSGYKSSCPTPDLSDSQCYGDRVGLVTGSKMTTGRLSAVDMNIRDGSQTLGRPVKKKKRNDSGFYDINLDHLMYLRQSLISAMDANSVNQTESAKSSIRVPHGKTDGQSPTAKVSESQRVECSFTSGQQQTADDRTQRPNEKNQRAYKATHPRNQRVKSLPNPSGKQETSIGEEDIDKIFSGQAEYYDLESVEEFPCSYVQSFEQQNQSKKTSRLATVKKLRGQEPVLEKPESLLKKDKMVTSDTDDLKMSTSRAESGSKKFTEVAKCMLEIIDDFQKLKLKSPLKSSGILETLSRATGVHHAANQYIDDPLARIRGPKGSSDFKAPSSHQPAADYHVYEEIIYDAATSSGTQKGARAREVPPPLPARPNGLKKSQQQGQGHEPKQRRNLYSLFTEQSDRRIISQSLERERVDETIDEYGFKASSSVV